MQPAPSIDVLRSGFRDPAADCRPMMRWWWFGPDVDEAEIDRELAAMAGAGIGGVEVSFVYPLRPGSPELVSAPTLARLRHAAEQAGRLGLRFDLTVGSGWSFGGPHIGAEHAARTLHWERREVAAPGVEVPVAGGWPGDELVGAWVGPGSVQEPPSDFTLLQACGQAVRVPPGSGPRQVLLAWSRLTGQVVKRAAAGADGPVLDHYSAEAARSHLREVAEPLVAAVRPAAIGSVFCDSLEVYGANWTPALPQEFARRRGYPLLPRLAQLVVDEPGCQQLRTDYYATLTELYEENFVAVLRDWAAGHGLPLRIQGYGTPPASVSSYRFADLYEGEGWGWKAITQTRWASSAAHLYGVPVVSSETWTWVHSPSFRATPLDLKGEAHEHLLAGVNQLIGHGWPYSPADAPGLGWFFYAAGALDDRNPWWPAMPDLMRYLQRLCWLMRQGEPVADVALYVPAADLHQRIGHEQGGSLDLWRETATAVDPAIPATLRENGYDFDLFDDEAVDRLDPAVTPVVVLPAVELLPEPTLTALHRYTADGGTVLRVGGHPPVGRHVPDARAMLEALTGLLAPDLAVRPATGDVGSVHRTVGGSQVHLLVNTGPHRREVTLVPRTGRRRAELWDPADGRVIGAGPAPQQLSVRLEPYQALVLVLTDEDGATVTGAGPMPGPDGETVLALDGPWTAQLVDRSGEPGEPTPVHLPHRWEDDGALDGYSGTVRYRSVVRLQAEQLAGQVLLDLGPAQALGAQEVEQQGMRGRSYRVQVRPPVGEVAQVRVNGRDCGTLWAPPYRIDVTEALRLGENEIELTVSSTAAAALAADTAIHEAVAASREHYGRRFAMQDLDLAAVDLHSGLLQVPVLRALGRPSPSADHPRDARCGPTGSGQEMEA